MELNINQELKDLIPPLTPAEYEALEKSIRDEGCRDKLIIWGKTIIDGHNRYEICKNYRMDFEVRNINFKDIHEAKKWMIQNQLARRNLTDSQRKYFIGKRYEEEKKIQGTNNQYIQSEKGQDVTFQNTAKEIAEENNISDRTVRRNADYSKAIDEIKETDPDIVDKFLSEEIKISNKDVVEIAQIPREERKPVVDLFSTGQAKNLDEAKQILSPIDIEYDKRAKEIDAMDKRIKKVQNLLDYTQFLGITEQHIQDYLNMFAKYSGDFIQNCDKAIAIYEEAKRTYGNLNQIRRVK